MYLGIPNNEDTLSTVGGPCHFDYKSLNYKQPDACAICVTGMICIFLELYSSKIYSYFFYNICFQTMHTWKLV